MSWTRVFKPGVSEQHQWVMPVDKADHEVFGSLYGESKQKNWKPIRMKLINPDLGKTYKEADFPWCGAQTVILRKGAVERLRPLLLEAGEFLPLVCDDAELSLWNVTNVVDALDYERSKIVRFPSSGRIMDIREHVFRPHLLGPQPAFKLPGRLPIYLGSRFVDEVTASGLTGLKFKQVWGAS